MPIPHSSIKDAHDHAVDMFPFIKEEPIGRTWTGLMPFTPDGLPLIGKISALEGCWIVSGLASSGMMKGPAAGVLLADLICG